MDVLILIASLAEPGPRWLPVPQAIVVFQPGSLAVPLSDSVALRPYVGGRVAYVPTVGPQAGFDVGIQVVWIRGLGTP